MKSFRENPDSEESKRMTKNNISFINLLKREKEVDKLKKAWEIDEEEKE